MTKSTQEKNHTRNISLTRTGSQRTKIHSRSSSLTRIGLDETIDEMTKANEESQMASINETQGEASVDSPSGALAPSAAQKSPKTLQPPFTARTRSASNASNLVSLAINPNDILSVMLSVLSVRSKQTPTATGSGGGSLFTIRCRMKNSADKSDKEILRVEKSIASLMELGAKLSSITGMGPFLSSFFDDFPVDKSGQRKVYSLGIRLIVGRGLLFRSDFGVSVR
jgi:hypothetical protein